MGAPQCPQPTSPLRPVCARSLRQPLPSLCSCPPTRALDATAPPQHPSLSEGGGQKSFPGAIWPRPLPGLRKTLKAPQDWDRGQETRDPPPDLRTQCYAPVLAFTARSLNRLGAGPRAHSLQPSPPSPPLSPSPFSSRSPWLSSLGSPATKGGAVFFRGCCCGLRFSACCETISRLCDPLVSPH